MILISWEFSPPVSSLGLWDTNRLPNPDQKTKPRDHLKKKKRELAG